jgi:hypothetical protein
MNDSKRQCVICDTEMCEIREYDSQQYCERCGKIDHNFLHYYKYSDTVRDGKMLEQQFYLPQLDRVFRCEQQQLFMLPITPDKRAYIKISDTPLFLSKDNQEEIIWYIKMMLAFQ